MSSDVMIVCQEFENDFDSRWEKEPNKEPKVHAFRIDEASMGEPHSQFGEWFVTRFCKHANLAEQIVGIKGQHWELGKFGKGELEEVKQKIKYLEGNPKTESDKPFFKEDCIDKKERRNELLVYLQKCIGKHISTENW